MSKIAILDASAALAYIQDERGADAVDAALEAGGAQMTAVNTCEVLTKLIDGGMPPANALAALDDLRLKVINFDPELARHAAELRLHTRSIGASLGDRACLALGLQASAAKTTAIVYTAEQAWTKIKWPFQVVVIRTGRTTR